MILTVSCVFAASAAWAQAPATAPAPPPAPPPPWTGSAGFGLSLNRGNTSTTNFSLAFDATHGDKTARVWKFKGLYLHGENNGVLAVDSLNLEARHERSLGPRWYAFANVQFLKDEFKDIDYLVAPGGGVGYKLVATPATTFNVDGGLGFKVEKNPGVDSRTNAVVTASDRFEHKLSPTATLTQAFGALWKASDFGDALYTFTAGVSAALTARTQLKFEVLDSYAARPPSADIKSNDVTLLTALVYKF
jgi:putative salt-induced outer membrane protein